MRCTSRSGALLQEKEYVYGMFFDNTFHSYLNLGKENPNIIFTARMMAIWICTSWVEKN